MAIILLSPSGPKGLSERPSLPATLLERGSPSIQGHTYFAHPDDGVSCVVWSATPYRIHPKQRADYEFSVLLEGSVVITDGKGIDTQVHAGDAFVLPPGFTYQWGQNVPTLKFALSYTPPQPPAAGAVFTLFPATQLTDPLAIEGQRVLFVEPNRRFIVTLEDLAGGNRHRVGVGHTLLYVVSGSVALRGSAAGAQWLACGESAFIAAGTDCAVLAESPARLLTCTVLTT